AWIQAITVGIFIGTLVLMVLEKLHRTTVALLGAAAMIVAHLLIGYSQPGGSLYTPELGFVAIDFNTLGLLFGMMVIVGVIAETGLFEFVAIRMAKTVLGNYWGLTLMLGVVSATASAFLDNVSTILLLIPITIAIAKRLELNPIPIIMVEILASNVGGAATLVGDPPNIMIGSIAEISFMSFVIHITPIVIITMLVAIPLFKWMFREEIKQTPSNLEEILKTNEWDEIKNMKLLKKSLIVMGIVIIFFGIHHILHIPASVVAILGAVALLVWGRIHPEDALRHVHWSTLIFFAALFVFVGGLVQVGVMDIVGDALVGFTGGNLLVALVFIIWFSAMTSATLSNIPATATMIPIIFAMEPYFNLEGFFINPMWWALSIGACFGGNGLLVGSPANLIAVGISEKFGFQITFRYFMRKAFPFMIVTLIVGTGLLLLTVAIQLALM
ncbi:MAG: ArsB/NhaD family transporter, partial [Thermoplasmata archaeon]|nr:ArsB/NhaD family transporter [Thermoplasmata archaeon]